MESINRFPPTRRSFHGARKMIRYGGEEASDLYGEEAQCSMHGSSYAELSNMQARIQFNKRNARPSPEMIEMRSCESTRGVGHRGVGIDYEISFRDNDK